VVCDETAVVNVLEVVCIGLRIDKYVTWFKY